MGLYRSSGLRFPEIREPSFGVRIIIMTIVYFGLCWAPLCWETSHLVPESWFGV